MDKQNYFITKNNKSDNFKELVDTAISEIEQLNMGDGSQLTPSYGFTSSPSTGIYLSNLHHISFSSLGVERFRIADTHITALEPIRLSATDFPALTFQGDLDTGLRWTADGDMAFMSNNANALRIWPSGVAVSERPFYVGSTTAGQEPFLMFEAVQATSLLSASTIITQRASASDRSLAVRNTSSSLGSADVAYRWVSSSGGQEHQLTNRLQHLGVFGSASVPTYSFQSAGTTGLFYTSTSPAGMRVSVGGTERMGFTSNGIRISPDGSGTEFRGLKIGRITTATQTGTETFSTAFPSGGAYRVYGAIESNSTTQVYSVHFHTISNTGFQWVKNYYNHGTSTLAGATAEPFMWIAIYV